MKTTISIPDPIFQAAEAAAKQLSMSRSELYTEALQAFLSAHGSDNVTEKLNEVHSNCAASVDPALLEMQRLSREEGQEW